MKACEYCGKTNEDSVQFCVGCGTVLIARHEGVTGSPSSGVVTKKQPRTLNAGFATIVLLTYLAISILCEVLLGKSNAIRPVGAILDPVVGGIAMIFVSSVLIPKQLKDTSPSGAAWVAGRLNALMKGLIIGLILGVCDQALILVTKSFVAYKSLDPLTRMAFTPGVPRRAWVVATMLLTPLVEEMMFRGVLYGGYCKSFGPLWAAASTTVVFVALHYPYYIHVPCNVIGIAVTALAMLWCRLRWNAIGPAIAAHVGYNCMVVLVALIY